MDRRWKVEAGCFSRRAEENRATAEAYGVAVDHVHTNWREMLEKEEGHLDALAVLTPTPTHAEIVMECMKAGYPVICEKSLAASIDEARAIIESRDRHNAFLAITYNYSGYPMVRELRSLIHKGFLGKIIHFQAEMPQEGFIRVDSAGNKPAPQSWRLKDGPLPTIYLDLGVHLHHLLHYLTAQYPLEVIADQQSYGWFDVIDNVTCLCRYSGDIQGQIWFSKSALGHRNGLRIRIYGTEAAAEWYQLNPEEIVLSRADGSRQILDRAANVDIAKLQRYNRFKAGHPAGFVEAFANLYRDIADSLNSYYGTRKEWKSSEVFGAELAWEGLLMLNAISQSTVSREWEKIKC